MVTKAMIDMMKKSITLLMVAMFSLHTMAQNVSNSEAFEVAQSFMAKKGVTLVNKNMTRGDMPYTVFHSSDGNGYAVVENGVVIAYSTEGSIDRCDLRPGTRTYELTPKTPIKPLIEAFWQQGSPYNGDTPIVKNPSDGTTRHAYVGCVPMSLAQIMYYYKNEGCEALEEINMGSSYPKLEALPATKFNWDLILPRYDNVQYTEEQAAEVSKLMKYVGYALHTYYGYSDSGSWGKPEWFTKLGFSSESYSTADAWDIGSKTWWNAFDEWKLTDKELEAILDKELEKGRPVMLSGYNREGTNGHMYIVDGRDNTGRYHIPNWYDFYYVTPNAGYHVLSQEMFMNDPSSTDIAGLNYVWLIVPIMPEWWVIPQTSNLYTPITSSSGMVYNLQGQRVGDSLEGLPKGIYIKDGKKQVVK